MIQVIAGSGVLSWFIQRATDGGTLVTPKVSVLTGFYDDHARKWLTEKLGASSTTVYVDKRGLEAPMVGDEPVALFGVDLAPSRFHPKVYYVESETEAHLLVGSANLTRGGDANFEAAIYLTGDEARAGWSEIRSKLGGLKLIVDLPTLNELGVARTEMETIGELWPHQTRAVSAFLEKRRGILEMATGTGKTRTAIAIINSLYRQGAVTGAIIATVGNDLLDQWFTELCKQTNFVVWREFETHHDLGNFRLMPKGAILLVSRDKLPLVLAECSAHSISGHILICDEVHSMGSPVARSRLSGNLDIFPYRLGLTATSEREYDPEGNDFIQKNVGEVIFRYSLADAIRDDVLCGFDYIPIEYELREEDRARVRGLLIRFQKSKGGPQPMSEEELFLQLSKVSKLCPTKIPLFVNYVRTHPAVLESTIIFVETQEYGEAVQREIIHYQPNYRTYYAEDDVEALEAFRGREVACLLTCHRISAGIDIRHVKNIVLFSSARAKLETIQRIGRCLRIDPEDPNKKACVIDFIRGDVGEEKAVGDVPHADIQRRDWLTEISKIQR